ncbi:MAG: hypothetical protein PHQ02_06805 [Candidatus Riflebacteria bacterium]|nr:hypothetical protein [Candidatus Riflebacteria bacterium]
MKHKTSAIFFILIGLIFAAQIALFAENNENAENAEPAEQQPADIYSEPFTESKLGLLQARIAKLKELHAFNHQSFELALAINAAANTDGFIRRAIFKLVESGRQFPFSSASVMAVFPEFLTIAENVRLKLLKKASDKLAENIYKNEKTTLETIESLRQSFSLIDEINAALSDIVQYSRNYEEAILKTANNTFISDCPADFVKASNKELVTLLSSQTNRLEALIRQYNHHKTLCKTRLDFIQKTNQRLSPVQQAIQLTQSIKSTNDFLIVAENYQIAYSAFLNLFEEAINGRREGLENLVDGFNIKKIQVDDYLYRYPSKDKVYELKPQNIEPEDTLTKVFDALNNLLDSPILKDILISEEDANKARSERLERAQMLADELKLVLTNLDWAIAPKIPEPVFEEDRDQGLETSEPEISETE